MSARSHMDYTCRFPLRLRTAELDPEAFWQGLNEMLYLVNKISWYLGSQDVYNALITKAQLIFFFFFFKHVKDVLIHINPCQPLDEMSPFFFLFDLRGIRVSSV